MLRIKIFASAFLAALLALAFAPCAADADSSDMGYTPYNDYFRLFDENITHRLSVYISSSEWNALIQDMKDRRETDPQMRTNKYWRADLLYEDEFGSMIIKDVGFRTRGNTSRTIPQDEDGYHRANFAIKFDETFDHSAGSPQYQALKSREFCGLEKLNLKWNLWTDESHIRELYCYELLSAAGVTAPEASLAALDIVIDGEVINYGVYTIIEPIDKTFLKKRYGKHGNDGNLYKCLWENTCASLEDGYPEEAIGIKDWESDYRPAYDLKTNKDYPDFTDLKSFINNINTLSDEDFTVYIEKNFNVDSFLRLMAINALAGACDDYRTVGDNYYLYFSNIGRAEMLPYDYDASLGAGCGGLIDWSHESIADADIYRWAETGACRPLLDRILAIDEYSERYEYYLDFFIDEGMFTFQSFKDMFESLKKLYEPYVCSDTADHGEEMKLTNEQWFFETKIRSVIKQIER